MIKVTQFIDKSFDLKSHECPHRLHGQIVKEQYFKLKVMLLSVSLSSWSGRPFYRIKL